MKVNSHNHVFTKVPRQLIAILIAGLFIFASVNAGSGAAVSIADTLGAATPATQFNAIGGNGFALTFNQFPGPKFTLTKPTTLTEIGGFVNNCAINFQGVPLCPTTLPLTVQIRPATNGLPDLDVVLGSFVLSHDNDPLLVSYESVAVNLTLKPGSYFALFAPQNNDFGFLLGSAESPFHYMAGSNTLGVLLARDGESKVFANQLAAVRILGETNVRIDGCDSGVEDVVLSDGSTISELVAECADGSSTHGQFVSCIALVASDLKKTGIITGQQKGALQRCAAQ